MSSGQRNNKDDNEVKYRKKGWFKFGDAAAYSTDDPVKLKEVAGELLEVDATGKIVGGWYAPEAIEARADSGSNNIHAPYSRAKNGNGYNLLRDLSGRDAFDQSGDEVADSASDDGKSILNLDGVYDFDGGLTSAGYGYQGSNVQFMEGKGTAFIPSSGLGNRGGKAHRFRPDEWLEIKRAEMQLQHGLSPSLKRMCQLCFIEQKTIKEIASIMNIKEASVSHQLSIIESHLKPILRGYTDYTFKDAVKARKERGEAIRRKL